jgi:two-component system sensor histidine kinase BarA
MNQKPTTPAIDRQLGLRLAGNKQDLANEIMAVLIKSLPHDIEAIINAKQEPDVLLQRVHKLHGAISYTGLPRIKKLLSELEHSLKNHTASNLDANLKELQIETHQILTEFAETPTHD